ncbi:hypothetical protein EON65_52145 [archaeon]|nr:MAG: hypothetical protein EON65_52145 [archaeon]
MFFGSHLASDNDEGVYDFDVGKPGNFKSNGAKNANSGLDSRIAPFSPIPAPKSAKSVGFSDESSNPARISSSDAVLDRAKSLMDKYSQKSRAPASNFRAKKASAFNEDDISLSMDDEDESDVDASDSYNVSDSYIEKPKKQQEV